MQRTKLLPNFLFLTNVFLDFDERLLFTAISYLIGIFSSKAYYFVIIATIPKALVSSIKPKIHSSSIFNDFSIVLIFFILFKLNIFAQ